MIGRGHVRNVDPPALPPRSRPTQAVLEAGEVFGEISALSRYRSRPRCALPPTSDTADPVAGPAHAAGGVEDFKVSRHLPRHARRHLRSVSLFEDVAGVIDAVREGGLVAFSRGR